MQDFKLRFELELKAYQDPGADFETWGRILIIVVQGKKQIILLDWEWDLTLLASWFFESQAALQHQILSIEGNSPLPSESLAQVLNRLREREFVEEEEDETDLWYHEIFRYYEKHGLRFALRGAVIPDIIIGLNHGAEEISCSSQEKEWAYQFDMNDFCQDLAEKLKQLPLKSGQAV